MSGTVCVAARRGLQPSAVSPEQTYDGVKILGKWRCVVAAALWRQTLAQAAQAFAEMEDHLQAGVGVSLGLPQVLPEEFGPALARAAAEGCAWSLPPSRVQRSELLKGLVHGQREEQR